LNLREHTFREHTSLINFTFVDGSDNFQDFPYSDVNQDVETDHVIDEDFDPMTFLLERPSNEEGFDDDSKGNF